MKTKKFLIFFLTCFFYCSTGFSLSEKNIRQNIYNIVSPYLGKEFPGVAVAVIQKGQPSFHLFGNIPVINHQLANSQTLFEIASVGKTFVGLLLSDMVLKKEVSLSDPVENFVPYRIPQWGYRKITLEDLVTHYSGLPRDFTNQGLGSRFREFLNLIRPERLAYFSVDEMFMWLARQGLMHPPGYKALYSNVGISLLGHALSYRLNKRWDLLLTERVFRPLGMKDTVLVLNQDQQWRSALGKNILGRFTQERYFPSSAIGPAGTILSTPQDMLRYISAHMGLSETPLKEAMTLAIKPRRVRSHQDGSMLGFTWDIFPMSVIGKNGSDSCMGAQVLFHPPSKNAVILFVNGFTRKTNEVAEKIFSLLLNSSSTVS